MLAADTAGLREEDLQRTRRLREEAVPRRRSEIGVQRNFADPLPQRSRVRRVLCGLRGREAGGKPGGRFQRRARHSGGRNRRMHVLVGGDRSRRAEDQVSDGAQREVPGHQGAVRGRCAKGRFQGTFSRVRARHAEGFPRQRVQFSGVRARAKVFVLRFVNF